jgi:hypothetical protein
MQKNVTALSVSGRFFQVNNECEMIYLIHYDRSKGLLVRMVSFPDEEREAASEAKLDLEISLLGSNGATEVVLLEASSEEHLRMTHRRYFETVQGLSNELCNLGFHSAPSGTRSSPNITWKLCSAGFQ